MNAPRRWGGTGQAIAAGIACAVLVGCDWVDSAGGSTPEPVRQAAPITLDEVPINGAAAVLEDRIVPLVVSRGGDPERRIRFETTPLDSGALDSCAAIDGFSSERAVDSLQTACAGIVTDCSVRVERSGEERSGEPITLELTIPALRAPVGLRYQIAFGRLAADGDGQGGFVEQSTRQIDLCLVPINDAPTAASDTYVVLENQELVVNAANGVLANDTDDDDASNEPLTATLSTAPTRAASFSLAPDGGFRYLPAPIDGGADVLDTFVYRAFDGGADSEAATVTVRIVTANRAPRQLDELPVLEGRVGDLLSIDFADFFIDPESGPLRFAFEEDLPDDGTLSLGSNGVLVGVPGEGDAGDYTLTLVVSDGNEAVSVPFLLIIEALDAAPRFVPGTVFSQSIRLGGSITAVRPRFDDPEGEPLTYRMVGDTGLSVGLSLDENTGVVSGRPRSRQLLRDLVVEAADPAGNTARSAPFSIRVR